MSHPSVFTNIMEYYDRTRGIGHSTAVRNGIGADTLVVCSNSFIARKEYGNRGIGLHEIGTLYGVKKPMVFDGSAIYSLCMLNDVLPKIKSEQSTVAELMDQIRHLREENTSLQQAYNDLLGEIYEEV